MMPPPIPNYPQPSAQPVPMAPPAAAPAPASAIPAAYAPPAPPQGYPGPAVAAPSPFPVQSAGVPAPAPAPAVGMPQPGQPYPAYAQPQAYPAPQAYALQAAPMVGAVDIGAAIANATGGDRLPQLSHGYQGKVEILESRLSQHPTELKFTFIAKLKIHTSNMETHAPGSEAVYIEGLQYGAGRIQAFLLNGAGYPTKAAFDQAFAAVGHDPTVALKALGNAAANPEVQQPGNMFGPNPLKGKFLFAAAQNVTRVPKKGKNAGQQVTYLEVRFAPAS